jgi:hypothetical protein
MPENRGGNVGCSLPASEYQRLMMYIKRTKGVRNKVIQDAIKQFLDRKGVTSRRVSIPTDDTTADEQGAQQ